MAEFSRLRAWLATCKRSHPMLRTLLPLDTATSFTLRLFGGGLTLCALLAIAALLLRRRRLVKLAVVGALLLVGGWVTLYATRPDWLRYALATPVPVPRSDFGGWTTRAPGLETGDIELSIDGRSVDRIALSRIDPRLHRFSVHWDGWAHVPSRSGSGRSGPSW